MKSRGDIPDVEAERAGESGGPPSREEKTEPQDADRATTPWNCESTRHADGNRGAAGIAFLWFIGVIRDRSGAHEDRFFATVFLGSGLRLGG